MREIHETIAARRPAQYTTVLKLLQIMAEKGLAKRDEKQRAHVYQAARPREWTEKQLAGDLLQRGFAGSAARLMQGALAAHKTSKAELAELRKLIEEFEKGTR